MSTVLPFFPMATKYIPKPEPFQFDQLRSPEVPKMMAEYHPSLDGCELVFHQYHKVTSGGRKLHQRCHVYDREGHEWFSFDDTWLEKTATLGAAVRRLSLQVKHLMMASPMENGTFISKPKLHLTGQ